MTPDYKTTLAQQVLNDGHVISYRQLSRELKVHGNVAKRMLFHFHKQQNSKRPGSIHAIYLLSGLAATTAPAIPGQSASADGEDSYMQSSPFMSSSIPQKDGDEEPLSVKYIAMCREEDLEGRQYGIIQNAQVKRRTGTKSVATAVTPTVTKGSQGPKTSHHASKPDNRSAKTSEGKDNQRRTSSTEETKPKGSERQQSAQEKKAPTKTQGMKRENSDIFKSFAKPRAHVSRDNTESSTAPSPAPQEVSCFPLAARFSTQLTDNEQESPASVTASKVEEDAHMSDESESEDVEEFLKTKGKSANPGGSTRSEREEQLRKMMDDDGIPQTRTQATISLLTKAEEDAIESTKSRSVTQADQQATSELSKEQSEEPPTNPNATTGGRRRGRRKVMKKKMLKDEEGYLVTKEEPAWESFSEEEPPPRTSTQASTASSTAKGKHTAGKPGQGNIMSFFGKK
ncbi:MAG: hypothetical protein Q9208_008484 [Pyrenodesmia sp. 3 TL-2023]